MPANRRNIFETIRDKRRWHTPPDLEAAKLGFRGWHSRGYKRTNSIARDRTETDKAPHPTS
jgi:hypothetical protein